MIEPFVIIPDSISEGEIEENYATKVLGLHFFHFLFNEKKKEKLTIAFFFGPV